MKFNLLQKSKQNPNTTFEMTNNIFKILADDVDDEVDSMDGNTPRPLFDIKGYIFTTPDGKNWATPEAIPLATQDTLYMMTWNTYHALVARHPILQTNTIIVGGKADWSEDVHHFPSMGVFGKEAEDSLDKPIRILVTSSEMADGLRSAFEFILRDLEVCHGVTPQGTDRPDLEVTLTKQDFELADGGRTWTTTLPKPIPLTRQTATYIPSDELPN